MAPKAPKKADAEATAPQPEQLKVQAECSRLKKKALDIGLLSDETIKPIKSLGVSKALAKCNGYDIIKKSSTRKGRYLVIVNAQLAPAAAGRLGSLSQMDSKNPIMYIDLPLGRLKLLGTHIFPKSKFVVMKSGAGHVLCEDVFESLLVFSEAWWVGRKEDNPEERRLPMPPELQDNKPHKNYHFTYGAQAKQSDAANVKLGSHASIAAIPTVDGLLPDNQDVEPLTMSQRPLRVRGRKSYADPDSDDMDEDLASVDEDEEAAPGGSKHPPPRRATAIKRSYVEVEEEEEGEKEEKVAKVPRVNSAKKQHPSAKHDVPADSDVVVLDSDDDDDTKKFSQASRPACEKKRIAAVSRPAINLVSDSEDGGSGLARASQGKRGLGSRSTSKKKQAFIDISEAEEGEDSKLPVRRTPVRANASKKTKVIDSEDNSGEDHEESESDDDDDYNDDDD